MPPEMLWSLGLSAAIGFIGWVLKSHVEEVAKEYVTKVEVHADINRIIMRIDNLDAKIDRILQGMSK